MTEEDILKEMIGDDDGNDDNLDKGNEEEDLEIVDESFQCPPGSVVMSTLDTISIFESVRDDVMALISKKKITNKSSKAD